MNRAALFVAGGIPRCRLSPETFITARRPLGITNVFDGDDRADRFSARRFAESEIRIDKKKKSRGGDEGYSSCYTIERERERGFDSVPSFRWIVR